jgi:hypothetical protein
LRNGKADLKAARLVAALLLRVISWIVFVFVDKRNHLPYLTSPAIETN